MRCFSRCAGYDHQCLCGEAGRLSTVGLHKRCQQLVYGFANLHAEMGGFALMQQLGMHRLEKRLAIFLAHGALLVCTATINGTLSNNASARLTASSAIGETGLLF